MVGEAGLEPASQKVATDFKSVVYTNSTTRPDLIHRLPYNMAFMEARTGIEPVYRVLQTLA